MQIRREAGSMLRLIGETFQMSRPTLPLCLGEGRGCHAFFVWVSRGSVGNRSKAEGKRLAHRPLMFYLRRGRPQVPINAVGFLLHPANANRTVIVIAGRKLTSIYLELVISICGPAGRQN